MRLTVELEATGGTTTGFRIPDEAVDGLGAGRRPKVVATVAGHAFRTSIARMGDAYWLGVSAARRAEAGIAAGEVHELEVVVDDAPRTVEVPEDLGAGLAADPAAAEAWSRLTYSAQRAHAESVAGAKKPETRAARVAKVLAALRG